MDGKAFLTVAQELVKGNTEAHWRAAAGRAYYALMLECRSAFERWGFTVPPGTGVHNFLRLRFNRNGDATLRLIGRALDELCILRNRADYELPHARSFANDARAKWAITQAEDTLTLLDQLEGDAGQLATAIAAIQTAWP